MKKTILAILLILSIGVYSQNEVVDSIKFDNTTEETGFSGNYNLIPLMRSSGRLNGSFIHSDSIALKSDINSIVFPDKIYANGVTISNDSVMLGGSINKNIQFDLNKVNGIYTNVRDDNDNLLFAESKTAGSYSQTRNVYDPSNTRSAYSLFNSSPYYTGFTSGAGNGDDNTNTNISMSPYSLNLARRSQGIRNYIDFNQNNTQIGYNYSTGNDHNIIIDEENIIISTEIAQITDDKSIITKEYLEQEIGNIDDSNYAKLDSDNSFNGLIEAYSGFDCGGMNVYGDSNYYGTHTFSGNVNVSSKITSSFITTTLGIELSPTNLAYIGTLVGAIAVDNIDNKLKYNDGVNWNTVLTTDANGDINTTGEVTSNGYKITQLDTAPSSSTDIGTPGEIRFTSTGIYVYIATNTWIKTAIDTNF